MMNRVSDAADAKKIVCKKLVMRGNRRKLIFEQKNSAWEKFDLQGTKKSKMICSHSMIFKISSSGGK